MRVLLISFSELPTLQRHLYVLAAELENLGVDVYTIGSKHLAIEICLGERNMLVETPPSPKPSVSSLVEMGRGTSKLYSMVERIRPDIIHFTNKHTWNYFLLRKLRKRMPQVKLFHTFHDPIGHDGDSVQKGVVLYHRLTQRLLDGVVVHSNIAQQQVEGKLRPRCEVFQVPLGEKPWRNYEAVNDGNKEALIFGRLNLYKGLCHYPMILDELYKIDSSINVTIAGKASDEIDGDLLAGIASRPNCLLKNEFIDDNDIDGYFREAGVVLIPYTSMTQSGVILDAYSRSRSVLAFDIPGMSQYVPDTESRVVPFDCKKFAEAIAERLADTEALNELNERVWLYGKRHFSPEVMAAGLLEAYKDSLA